MTFVKHWNWQQDDWPHFTYETATLQPFENLFLQKSGMTVGILKHLTSYEQDELKVDLISNEALNTSEIEGEILNRDSLQSSIKREFGLQTPRLPYRAAEAGIAEMMVDLYNHYDQPLTHKTLWSWHQMLMNGRRDLADIGRYRTHEDPMQVVSGYIDNPKVHFEAPTSSDVSSEMEKFIEWFNRTSPKGKTPLSPLVRSGITHLYFVCIHPFEDGNGRIGRALVEKVLAQHLKHPTLIALSQIINGCKKDYYEALEIQNKHNLITSWLTYFSKTILEAQDYTIHQIEFLINKTKFFDEFKDQMNDRQTKVVARMMKEGIHGFKGGLSAENYTTIAQTSSSTATRDLQDLVEKKILIRTGNLKATRYWLPILKVK